MFNLSITSILITIFVGFVLTSPIRRQFSMGELVYSHVGDVQYYRQQYNDGDMAVKSVSTNIYVSAVDADGGATPNYLLETDSYACQTFTCGLYITPDSLATIPYPAVQSSPTLHCPSTTPAGSCGSITASRALNVYWTQSYSLPLTLDKFINTSGTSWAQALSSQTGQNSCYGNPGVKTCVLVTPVYLAGKYQCTINGQIESVSTGKLQNFFHCPANPSTIITAPSYFTYSCGTGDQCS